MPLDPTTKKSTAESRAEDHSISSDGLNHLCNLLEITTVEEKRRVRDLVTFDPVVGRMWAQYGIIDYAAPLKALTVDELDL